MARDRKRAKQRRERRARARARRAARRQQARARGRPGRARPRLGDVDEFDAALVRGADGVAAPDAPPSAERREPWPRAKSRPRRAEGDLGADELEEPAGAGRRGRRAAAARRRRRRRRAAPRARRFAAATARSRSCAPAGPSSSACSGPTAARSRRPPPSCSASSRRRRLSRARRLRGQGNRRIHPLTPARRLQSPQESNVSLVRRQHLLRP